MNCSRSLCMMTPAHGSWGVTKMAQILPESFILFVGPAACGRHGALSASQQGRKERAAYLALSEADIVSGSYERAVVKGADELLTRLSAQERMPKAVIVFVTCIDSLLGTDHEALLKELRERHPGTAFTFCRMNPTTESSAAPPKARVRDAVYQALSPRKKDRGVNLIGSMTPVCGEAAQVLASMGAAPMRQVPEFRRFDDFQAMAASRLNIVIAPMAVYTAQQMEKRLSIPWISALTSADPGTVRGNYWKTAEALGVPCPDLSFYEKECEIQIEKAKSMLGSRPVVIDGDAVPRPFDMARSLLKLGFSVKRVSARNIPSDDEDLRFIEEHFPGVEIRPLLEPAEPAGDPELLCIGLTSAYLSGSKHFVPFDGEPGLWGFSGIVRLMRELCAAAAAERDVRTETEKAGGANG